MWAETVNTGDLITSGLSVDGASASWKEIEVVTGGSVEVSTQGAQFHNASGNLQSITYVTGATFKPKTAYIKYLGG